MMSPDTICHTPQKAATSAIPPRPLKKLKINNIPKPEFCIPVSIAKVRLSFLDKPDILAILYPKVNAKIL